jgi:hypothetical protein
MPGSIRVVYQPSTHLTDDQVAVLGAVVDLSRFGRVPSSLSLEQEHEAELVFHAAFLSQARKISEPEFEPFASLRGKLKLDGAEPRFTIAAGSLLEYTGERPEKPRRLALKYGAQFSNAAGDPVGQLDLPTIPEDARFFELGIELKVDGGVEASVQENDRLDVPLEAITFFEVEIVDDDDAPMANRNYELELSDGSTLSAQSDAQGVVRIDPIFGGAAVLRSTDDDVSDETGESAEAGPGATEGGPGAEVA